MSEPESTIVGVRDIANEAEAMVIALPQTLLSMLLCCAVPDNEESGEYSAAEWSLRDKDRLIKALRYVDTEFVRNFTGVVDTLSADLSMAQQALDAALKQALDEVTTLSKEVTPARLIKLARLAEVQLAPAVAAFLGALFDQVVAHEKASAKRAQDVDSNALSQIDVISRQINFIAVNASVEAARVGEQGRGFAVIASEIKALSEQSRSAVDRIRLALT